MFGWGAPARLAHNTPHSVDVAANTRYNAYRQRLSMNTDRTTDIAFSGFMAGWSLSSSVGKALEIFDDLPAAERPCTDRTAFRRAAACAIGMFGNTRTTHDDVRNALSNRFGA